MQGMADGLKLLVRAYELDPHHVGVLNTLSHYCLLRAEYEKVWIGRNDVLEGRGMEGGIPRE